MCTTFLVNETLSSGRCGNYFRSFFMTDFHPRGIHSAGMSIFLLFLRRLWIALDANSHAVLKQCVASNRYARKNCEIFSKCLRCVSLSNECGHVENSYVFINNTNDLGVKTLITDCFVLRTSTILTPHSQSMGPPPHFLLMCGRVNKVYLHLHTSMTWRIPFDTVIILIKYDNRN